MSSRALRRLQKEQIPEPPSLHSEEEEEEYIVEKPKKFNPFDLLNADDDVGEEEEEEEEEVEEVKELVKEVEKPVKKPQPTIEKPSKNKKNKKKNKKKNTEVSKKNEVEDISMKELDKVLKSMDQHSTKTEQETRTLNTQLLSVNYRYLDAEAEMKRLFGSHVVNSENRANQGRVLKKSKMTSPKSDWPPYKRNGLSMELVETKDGISYFAFRHSEQYQDIQLEFLQAIVTHNPEALLFLTRRHPYHVDALLQLSEIAKHSGDWSAAGDFIERALYACERAFHPQFSMSSGTCRLSYKRSENRSFFLAIFRHIQFLTRRGCWRTSFEFNKLLFSLDPITDPLGSLLSLDYYGLSCRDFEYVIKMHSTWRNDGQIYPIEMSQMPNFAYSAAYAQFKLSEKSKQAEDVIKSNKLIKEAIKKYPLVYCRLLEKLGEAEVPELVQLTQYMPNEYMEIMQLSYIERTHEMWKEPEVLEWLKSNGSLENVLSHPELIQLKVACQQRDTVPINICRYIVMIDIRTLMSYLPSSVTEGSYHMYDPLPPEDSTTMYDLNAPRRARPADPSNLMGVLRHMLGGGQIPGADQEQIRILMHELENIRNRTAHQAPGAFPGEEEEFDDEPTQTPEEPDEVDLPELLDQHIQNRHRELEELQQLRAQQTENLTQEELMEIMNALEEDDLELQRVLQQTYERQ